VVRRGEEKTEESKRSPSCRKVTPLRGEKKKNEKGNGKGKSTWAANLGRICCKARRKKGEKISLISETKKRRRDIKEKAGFSPSGGKTPD